MSLKAFRAAPWIILLASFLILIYFYGSLPSEILIARGFFGGEPTFAAKSLFTVFRVPLIELICALAILIMLGRKVRPEARQNYRAVWLILLFTVSLKALFQSLEAVSPPPADGVFFYITIAVIAAGVAAALIPGRRVYIEASRENWTLSAREKLALAGLLVMYLGIAIVPIFVFRS